VKIVSALVAAGLSLCPAAAWAGLAIAANDGKQLQKGEAIGVTPDSVSVIDLGKYPPKVIGTVKAPAAMIGSPNAVAVSRTEKFAIVTAAQKVNPADPMKPTVDDRVSVIDLSNPAKPKVIQTIAAGLQASGVSINRAENLVLVASRADGAVTVFSLTGNRLARVGRIDLGAENQVTDVAFTPDGRHAYVTIWEKPAIIELAIDGTKVTRTGNDMVTGRSSYGAVVTPDGRWLINTNVGGAATGADRTGTIAMVDLKTHKLAQSFPVGRTPEHATLSPDGKHLLVVLANGAAYVKTDPTYGTVRGILKILAVGPGTLKEVAQAPSCHWNQGATWSDDGKVILAQCASERTIEVYRFNGKSLVRDDKATIAFESRPGSIATRHSR
jgi:DNA-binding beta-propeller fold protein YncE